MLRKCTVASGTILNLIEIIGQGIHSYDSMERARNLYSVSKINVNFALDEIFGRMINQ